MTLLLDNGSKRAGSTLVLRQLATRLSARIGRPVIPVSLQHADSVHADQLNGRPAQLFADVLRRQLASGVRRFDVVPLFFGLSRALTRAIPDQVASLNEAFGDFELRLAQPISSPEIAEPRLVSILETHIAAARDALGASAAHVIVVDHGSPLPQVTAVRTCIAEALRMHLCGDLPLSEAVMERRPGAAFDFNGPLLADALAALAAQHPAPAAIVALLFLAPGRHAGPGGDVEQIVQAATAAFPQLRVQLTPLVGEHPLLVDILAERLASLN